MEESQRLLTREEEGREEFTPSPSSSKAPTSVSAPSAVYLSPLETVPLGPPPEYTSHSPVYTDNPFSVLLQDGRQGVLVRDPTGVYMVVADVTSQNNGPPNNYRYLAILSILCVCFPVGIVAMWQSLEVDRRYASGDYRGALKASQAAYKWSVASLLVALTTIILFFFIRFYFHDGYQYNH